MAVVKPFPCVRPDKKYAACVAALPYDVYNRKEAKAAASANPKSFLNIDRPETQFPDEDCRRHFCEGPAGGLLHL